MAGQGRERGEGKREEDGDGKEEQNKKKVCFVCEERVIQLAEVQECF